MHRSASRAFTAAVLAAAAQCSAQISFFDIYYSGYTAQYTEAPPPPANQFTFASRIFCTSAADISAAQVRTPGAPAPTPLNHESAGVWSFYSASFSTQEALLDAYPTGPYLFQISGGLLGFQQATIARQVDLFLADPPVYTQGTVTALQGLDPSQDFTIRFSSFEIPEGGNVALSYISVYTLPNFGYVYGAFISQPSEEAVIPAGTLPPDTSLAFYLSNSARFQYSDGGFGSAEAIIAFDLTTYTQGFSTAGGPPCPADFNQDGGVDGADVEAFFLAWEQGEPESDVNQDGGIDGADVETFFIAWENGGCD